MQSRLEKLMQQLPPETDAAVAETEGKMLNAIARIVPDFKK